MDKWERLSRETVYRTGFFEVHRDRVLRPDGQQIDYGVIEFGHCVGVLPILPDGSVVLVRQYRYIAGRATWEMPTGGVDAGESPEQAAQRELAEEAGYRAGSLRHLSTYHTSKSSVDETAHLYLGEALQPAVAEGDDTEFIDTRVFDFDEVLSMVEAGEIVDSMTIIAVLKAALDRSRG